MTVSGYANGIYSQGSPRPSQSWTRLASALIESRWASPSFRSGQRTHYASAIISAELTDERERLIASASVVVQLVKDISRYA